MGIGNRYQQAFAKVAKFFLTLPCSTVDVERLFATAFISLWDLWYPMKRYLLLCIVEPCDTSYYNDLLIIGGHRGGVRGG